MTRVTWLLLVAVVALGLIAPARAGDGVPLPHPAKGRGTQCVEPSDTMRRNHMDYLMHQRDETMHQGIRGKKYSLADCVECHATPDARFADGRETLAGFCLACHTYAAVTIDCFGCHTPVRKPQQKSAVEPAGHDALLMALRQRPGEETAR